MDSENSPSITPGQPPLFDFTKEKARYDKIIADFENEKNKVTKRRELRENRKNVLEERQKKVILEDETIIPDRTINTNIRVGRGPYIAYLTQAKRLLIITQIDAPQISIEPLELWFTRGMRYPDWKTPWIRAIDGFHTHGGTAIEVMYDPEKPLNVSWECVPREHLIFPCKTRDIQACPHLLRAYELTTLQLEEFSEKHGFDPAATKEVLDKFSSKEDFIIVYRVLCKKNGIVYNAWYTKEYTQSWLRAPEVHNIGLFDFETSVLQQPDITTGLPLYLSPIWDEIKPSLATPKPLRLYPIYWISYEITENETLLEAQGRVALDLHVQEALTHLLTNTVNATRRASSMYPHVVNDPTNDPGNGELQPLRPGMIYPRELGFIEFPWPNNIILAVMQAMRIEKSQEAGHSDFAAMARKDANKTATEMELAATESQNSVTADMDVYSSPVLKILALCFEIARHQAIMGLCKRPPNPELLLGDYNLVPAGDVEVVKRAEDKQNAKEFFNIVQGTPAAEKVLFFLIERFFPDQADEWKLALQGPDKDGIIVQLINVLSALPTDGLTPDQQSAIATIIATASSVVASRDNQAVPGALNSGPTGPSIQSAPDQAVA